MYISIKEFAHMKSSEIQIETNCYWRQNTVCAFHLEIQKFYVFVHSSTLSSSSSYFLGQTFH